MESRLYYCKNNMPMIYIIILPYIHSSIYKDLVQNKCNTTDCMHGS